MMYRTTPINVDALFATALGRGAGIRENPVTGSKFVLGLDPIGPQKRMARKALEAWDTFERNRSVDVPSLPLTYRDREALKQWGFDLDYLTALYARSWEAVDYDSRHPDFETYVRGYLAQPHLSENFRRASPWLLDRFPPKPCPGLAKSSDVDMRAYVRGLTSCPDSSVKN